MNKDKNKTTSATPTFFSGPASLHLQLLYLTLISTPTEQHKGNGELQSVWNSSSVLVLPPYTFPCSSRGASSGTENTCFSTSSLLFLPWCTREAGRTWWHPKIMYSVMNLTFKQITQLIIKSSFSLVICNLTLVQPVLFFICLRTAHP